LKSCRQAPSENLRARVKYNAGTPSPVAAPAQRRSTFDRSLIEGPIGPAVWKIAWPTMLQNVIGGLQGVIDHAMVGHFVGYRANAAIGVSWQIVLVIIVFAMSVFTGMGVLVSRFAGANEPDKVNKVGYQAFLTAAGMSVLLGTVGWFAAPGLLRLVNAAPEVQAEALPFLRTMLVGILGMMIFFMLSGAFRAAGDSRTPLRLGVLMTGLTIAFNLMLIPAFGTIGAAFGTVASSSIVAIIGVWRMRLPDSCIPVAVPVWSADRRAGHRDERGRRPAAAIHRIAAPQRGGAGGLCRRVHGTVLVHHMDVGGLNERGGDDRRPKPGRGPS
jgi:hypothetical protein